MKFPDIEHRWVQGCKDRLLRMFMKCGNYYTILHCYFLWPQAILSSHSFFPLLTQIGRSFAKASSTTMNYVILMMIISFTCYSLFAFTFKNQLLICVKMGIQNDSPSHFNGSINQNPGWENKNQRDVLCGYTTLWRVWTQICGLISVSVKSSAQDVFLKVHLSYCVYDYKKMYLDRLFSFSPLKNNLN